VALHHHPDLEQDIERLRARLEVLEQQVRVMTMLQTAARVLLGLPPEVPRDT
jgi:hypothetical protein